MFRIWFFADPGSGLKSPDPDPFIINLGDLNDGFDKALEEPDRKGQF